MTNWRDKPRRKSRKVVGDILRERNERRTAALIACISELSSRQGPDAVTHAVVAERTGLPVQYVRWKYPLREHLLSIDRAQV